MFLSEQSDHSEMVNVHRQISRSIKARENGSHMRCPMLHQIANVRRTIALFHLLEQNLVLSVPA